ncbi:MAG: valine--tRNA ligase [Euryarchaeota archaeon]|nr:valine--tRNA ligase [Euryarchaeota archaeon]|tara:strand:- start:3817 stop:6444 length:2628 start_codon:yes stop_codon:yes gene_type:complete
MEIPAKYDPRTTEDKWYSYWMENGYFNSTPDEREPYTVVIPPPNVTGVLHMGHMLNNTIQDVLVRRARMKGLNACWVPGTDHASIATEAKVVRKLREEGVKKSDLSRDEFLSHAWDWTHKHGGIILDQLKKLGASCDWDRTRFTMDEGYYEGVIDTFIHFYNEGLIYRGVRMVNWDPVALTALSDEEVIHKEENGKLYHVRYKIVGTEDEWITVATTRPETILGDTAICVHPDDDRYTHLHGKKAIIPICNREVPIIQDDYIDIEFGTGCLKVTPAHDINDYELGIKHGLEVIDTISANGTMSEHAVPYEGMDRFAVRKQLPKDLEKLGNLVKIEDYTNKVGRSERTDAVIEPRLSLQWFMSMEKLAKPALDHVMDDTIQFHPAKFKNSYRNWMENIKDWCVSRQLWWGHRIPAFYYGDGDDDFVVAKTMEEAIAMACEKSGASLTESDLKQDEDVMDTWFSSWIWPIQVFDGLHKDGEVDYYYPTNDLVTAPEIMFFWVARMIMSGYHYRELPPFKNVYFTGIVRDDKGRKMSKSLGNSPDPIELMEKYGADGVRVGMLLTSPAGNDLPFDEKLCETGRNFSNKIWNAFRLVQGWEVDSDKAQPESAALAVEWMNSRVNAALVDLDSQYGEFRLSEALMTTYRLVWEEFCSWYLELIKPPYGEPIDSKTLSETLEIFEKLLKILHPFMPFLTEEVWHWIGEKNTREEALIIAEWPSLSEVDYDLLKNFESLKEIVGGVRNVRKENNIPNKEKLNLKVQAGEGYTEQLESAIAHLTNLDEIEHVNEKVDGAFGFMVGRTRFYIPFSGGFDVEAEKAKIQKDLDYQLGFLNSVRRKLSNEKFVNGAPEAVVANERNKEADAVAKIAILEEKLADLG